MLTVEVNFLLIHINIHTHYTLFFLHFLQLWLQLHVLAMLTGMHALRAGIEVTLLAIMEYVCHFSAYLALSF